MHPLVRLWRYAGAYRTRIRLAVLYTVINKLFDILPEVLIGVAVDVVVRREGSWLSSLGVDGVETQLYLLAAITAVVWMSESAFEYAYEVAWRDLAQALQHELRLDVYRHVQSLDVAYFEDKQAGAILSTLNDDINQLERFLNDGATQIILVIASTLLCGVAFVVVAPGTALFALAPIPVILYGAYWFQGRLERRYLAVRAEAAELNGLVGNNLGGLTTIRAFGREDHEAVRVEGGSARYREANRRAIRLSSAITPVIRMAIMAGFIATLVVGGHLTLRGELAVGAYSVFVFLTQRLLWPLTRLAQVTDMYNRSMASARRAFALLDTPLAHPAGTAPLGDAAQGDVRFEGVEFAYADGPPVLRGLTLTAAAGRTTALVGTTGAGKSTVMKLLLKFYRATGGAITLGGRALDELDDVAVRAAVGYVGQDVFLIDGTIADNIRYGRLDASDAEVEVAARAAAAHDFIAALPDGYATRVGERGQKLSGGQRQRLAIARALVRDPAILILDEATSAVDNETEAAIARALADITRGRTTIMVAHRLSTIRHADEIFVLENGAVLERGTHEELVARGGAYAALWRLQTGD
ncbi:MAG: ABC transporter ATP-binding protein [Kofleriaceae bacterium]|nr:ABC transporter ATP-binding protein [Kofleriaceae bacterium]MBP9168241.1 ABC transporter ATP-binding protein [Kofleriaceae bacterium]MBP9860282.1 ABC transporter ATP-binding protein [Kofleriaceae bacterium]